MNSGLSDNCDECFGFERLLVWQKAIDLVNNIYEATKSFPVEEMFGLIMQLRRASVSVAANISEGASRSSGKDQARFFEIAYGSLNEIMTLLHVSLSQRFIGKDQFVDLRSKTRELCRMLSGLKRTVLSR